MPPRRRRAKARLRVEDAPPHRAAFATFSEFAAAAFDFSMTSDHPEARLFLGVLPETVEDWIEYETTYRRRWWAVQPLLPGDEPSPEDLDRVAALAREKAREYLTPRSLNTNTETRQ